MFRDERDDDLHFLIVSKVRGSIVNNFLSFFIVRVQLQVCLSMCDLSLPPGIKGFRGASTRKRPFIEIISLPNTLKQQLLCKKALLY